MTKTLKAQENCALTNDSSIPTLIEFLLDETGSMSSCKAATISGYNSFLEKQRELDGTCLITLTKFDTSGQKTPYTDMDVSICVPLNSNTFLPGASTNLRDTIGDRINAVQQRVKDWHTKPNILFVVMTDGADNASRSYSEKQIHDLLKQNSDNGFTFVYLGATPDALQVANRLGFSAGNSKQFETSEMVQTMDDLATATAAYRYASRSSDTAKANFF